jgi:hypothetical protein
MMKLCLPRTGGRRLMANCTGFSAGMPETVCGWKQLSEKGRIQRAGSFFSHT